MKTWKVLSVILFTSVVLLFAFSFRKFDPNRTKKAFVPPKGCVFRTIMGEESSDSNFIYKTPELVQKSIDKGLSWIALAQNKNGGWGCWQS